MLTRPYVAGILGLVFFQEVLSAFMDIQMNSILAQTLSDGAARTAYLFNFSLISQSISSFFALTGTSFAHRTFGTRFCLVGFPVTLLACGVAYVLNPSLYVVTLFMILIKALHYAFNQPIKERLISRKVREEVL